MFYTYVIKRKKDKKCYMGETADLRKRFREHGENKAISTNDKLKRFLSLTGFTLIEIL